MWQKYPENLEGWGVAWQVVTSSAKSEKWRNTSAIDMWQPSEQQVLCDSPVTTREQWLTSSNYWEPVAKWATTTTILSPTDCATKLHLSVSSSVKILDVFHTLEGDQSIMMMFLIIISIILMMILIVIIPFSRPISSGIFISISDSSRLRETPIQKLTNLIEILPTMMMINFVGILPR